MRLLNLMLVFAFCILAQAAAAEVWPESWSKRGGVIGAIDFKAGAPAEAFAEVNASVGIISIRRDGGKRARNGVGTLVRDKGGRKYVLTARHVLYDVKSGERQGDIGEIILQNEAAVDLDIAFMPEKASVGAPRDDYIFIPLRNPYTDAAAIPMTRVGISLTAVIDRMAPGRYVMASVVSHRKRLFRYFQDNFILSTPERGQPPSYAATDADAFGGMSGSPVFAQIAGAPQLVGVLTAVTNLEPCPKFGPNCWNVVVLLPSGASPPASYYLP
jgi:hypothetical protein